MVNEYFLIFDSSWDNKHPNNNKFHPFRLQIRKKKKPLKSFYLVVFKNLEIK